MFEARPTKIPPQEEPTLAVGTLPRLTAELDLGTVTHLRHGEGPPVLLVHGIPTSARLWEPLLGTLGERYDCIAPDLLGLGRSRARPGVDVSSPGQADAFAALLDHLDLDEVLVVAHDQGGAHVQQFMVRHPDRIAGVVLCDVVCFDNWPVPAIEALMRVAALSGPTAWLGRTGILERLLRDVWPLPRTVHRGRLASALTDDWFDALRVGGEDLDAWRGYVCGQSNRWTLDAVPTLERWEKPAHVIWATDDHFLPLHTGVRLAETIPTAGPVTLLERAGHFFQAEIPVTASRVIGEALDAMS